MILIKEESTKKIIAIIKNGDIKETYECKMSICINPICTCSDVDIILQPISKDSESISNLLPRKVKLDIFKESLAYPKDTDISQEERDFAHTFYNRLDQDDYWLLRKEHFSYKNQLTENAELKNINAYFPIKDIEQHGFMVAYNDVLPYGNQLLVSFDDIKCVVFDQYCVKISCDCSDIVLNCFAVDKSMKKRTGEELFACWVNYKKRTWKNEEDFFNKGNIIDLKRLQKAIEEKYPNIYRNLKIRHHKLKTLYAYYKKRHIYSQQPDRIKEVGRNEPCPCGSGKKYKRCCGR